VPAADARWVRSDGRIRTPLPPGSDHANDITLKSIDNQPG
jgi:hypothetical protein